MDTEKAVGILTPYFPNIQKAILGGWSEWKGSTECGRFLFKRTRSNVVSDLMNKQAMSLFYGIKGVHAVQKYQSVKFIFEDKILLRIKKADRRRRTGNIMTIAENFFRNATAQLQIWGNRELFCLEAVYVLNSLETEIQAIEIIARKDGKLLWNIPLSVASESKTDGMSKVVPLALSIGALLQPTEEAVKLADARKAKGGKQIG